MPSASQPKFSAWEFFQNLGKTFMLPVALLAFCGILLGIGSSFSTSSVLATLPFLDNPFCQLLFKWMTSIGSLAFTFLPVLFSVAIPLGMVKEERGIAAFSGFVGYAAFNLSINFSLAARGILASAELSQINGVKSVLGIPSLDTGVLGAIIVGIIVYRLHNRFYTISLPDAFAFFGGARFVPIISSLTLGIIGLTIPFFWPYFIRAITAVGETILASGPIGPFIFGTGEALLRPLGLHHILVALIRFTEAGGTLEVCGNNVSGALNIFYAQLHCTTDPQGFANSATSYLSQGKMPAYLGGLPGAALAMYHCANKENRHKIKGLLISGVVACVVGGITEPLEFMFLVVAPVLYFIHALLVGAGFMLASITGVTIGNTDGNIIDLIVFGVLQGTSTKWYLIPFICAVWFFIYYLLFSFAIKRFDIKTPGRDMIKETEEQPATTITPSKNKREKYDVEAILAALGGASNITTLDNCITRLRLSVDNMELVDEEALRANGAIGVVKLDAHNLQVVIGPQVHIVKQKLDQFLPH